MVLWSLVYGQPPVSMVLWPLVYGLSPPIPWSYGLWSMVYPLRFHGPMAFGSMASALWFYGVKFCDGDLHIYNLFTNFAFASTFCRRLSPA